MVEFVLRRWRSSVSLRRLDRVWAASCSVVLLTGLLAWPILPDIIGFTLKALAETGPYIAFATLLIAWLKATGAEAVITRVFQGREIQMVLLASVAGGLVPFCSCEVIPFIAALLASGVPLSAIMAFWLASPIMDPPMFLITKSTLGLDFALGKTVAAVGFGLFGGICTMLLSRAGLFENQVRTLVSVDCCNSDPLTDRPVWSFWNETERRSHFRETAIWNLLFLLKWMTLAYLLEALLLEFVPSALVASVLGGEGIQPVLLGALLGAPAYLNGYAALPVVAGMVEQGMSQGAAMAFVLAGSVTCIPAAVAVWALVKQRVFAAYLGLAILASLIGGFLWGIVV